MILTMRSRSRSLNNAEKVDLTVRRSFLSSSAHQIAQSSYAVTPKIRSRLSGREIRAASFSKSLFFVCKEKENNGALLHLSGYFPRRFPFLSLYRVGEREREYR